MAVAIAYKPDRLTFYRGYSWDFTAQIQTPDPLDPKSLLTVDPTGWTAELEIRDERNVQKIRLQTSPAPPSAPASTGQGQITIDSANKRFSIEFSSSAEWEVPAGAYLIEAKAWDTSGSVWPLIPLRPCDVLPTILRGA